MCVGCRFRRALEGTRLDDHIMDHIRVQYGNKNKDNKISLIHQALWRLAEVGLNGGSKQANFQL